MFKTIVNRLEDGLKVIRVPMRSMRSITAMAAINVGSRYELDGERGMSHLIEHLVFQGTDKFPTHLDLSRRLDQIGADTNAFTAKEYTGYFATTISEHLDVSLEILSQLLFKPRLSPASLEKEKEVVIQEIGLVKDNPSQYISNLFERLVYSNTGLAHDISGSKQDVKQITANQIKAFMNDWYQKPNMVLVLAGDEEAVRSDQVLQKAINFFVDEESTEIDEEFDNKDARIRVFLTDSPISDQRLVIENRDTAQNHFLLGWPALKRKHPDKYALSVLSTIIGGNRSSRLFAEVRERLGLAYYIWSDIDQYHDTGIIGAQGALNPTQTLEGLTATIDQFKLVADEGRPITGQEVESAKDYVLGRMMLGLEDSQSVARYYALKDILLDEIESPDEVAEKVRAVSLDRVRKLAKQLFIPSELRLALIGPYQDKKSLQSLLN